MINLTNVTKIYDNQTALRNITLTVEKGEMAYVTGASGAGKTTLLKIIYHAEKPDEGSILISGWEAEKIKESHVPLLRRNIGIVFQDFRLLSNISVFDNVALSLRVRGIPERETKPLVFETLKQVNLRHKADSFPLAISGGEQQRVVIARAIVGEPMILLADEPTGNLDADNAAGIIELLKNINAKGTTILVATHNRELFRNTGKRVFRLDSGNMVGEETG